MFLDFLKEREVVLVVALHLSLDVGWGLACVYSVIDAEYWHNIVT